MKPLIDTYSAKLTKFKGNLIQADINEQINVQRLKTMYGGYEGDRIIEVRFVDPRRFTVQQRNFIYALLGDIFMATGQPTDSLKEIFYMRFEGVTGRSISLNNESHSTVSDANLLADIIIDFIFENHIPFRNGYDILPANQEYYLYKCITKRVCAICGKTGAEIDHFDKTVGMGRDRKSIDHSDYTFIALCNGYQSVETIEKEVLVDGINGLDTRAINEVIRRGGHHSEKHIIGLTAFKNKYHVEGIKLNKEIIKELRIGG